MQEKKKIVCYGAAVKRNTVLNFCEITKNSIDYVVDTSPHKQGKFLPGTHIPIYSPEKIKNTKPDYIVILAWNLKDEIIEQMNFVKGWGGQFVVLIPEVGIFEELEFEEVFKIDLEKIEDERGFFSRSWNKKEFEVYGLNSQLVQCNISFNKMKGTIRELDFQKKPHEEAKFVRYVKGKVTVIYNTGNATSTKSPISHIAQKGLFHY